MELFLTIITIVLLVLIGAEVFSVLLALSRRMADDIIERQKLEEAEEAAAEAAEVETAEAEVPDTNTGKVEATEAAVAVAKVPQAADTDSVEAAGADTKESEEESKYSESAKETPDTTDDSLKDIETALDQAVDEIIAEPTAIDEAETGFHLPKNDFVCESCGEVLKGYDLIPFISFIVLKGRCRFCGDKIPARDFFTELLGGFIFLVLFFRFGMAADLTAGFQLKGVLDITAAMTPLRALTILVLAVVTCILFWIASVDALCMEIPNVLNLLIFLAGVSSIWLLPQITWKEHLIGMVCVSLPLLLITLLIPGAFGGGDIKLMFGAGLLLGWKLVVVALFFGVISGGIYAVCLLAKKKAGRKDHFAFGPFLCFGITLSMICGTQILNMYLEVGRRMYGKF
ncbi:MAG: prepilin peptidase [Lachnospiraceae bacterium]|nr:prepilin peptidase [Lachnospiraceae bacterium]